MKILYGVVGEGMGHAIRSKVVLEHLTGRGHHVEIMASGRAVKFLKSRFSDVNEIHGLHMIAEENRIRRGKTLLSNVRAGLSGVPKNIRAYFDLIDDFSPDVVISDFESWTYFYAKAHDLPIISIDNMQVINRCKHPPEILDGVRSDFEIARAFVKSKLPFCNHYLVSAFFRSPIRKSRTTLVPPILRPVVLDATPSEGDHLLVYQTKEDYTALLDALRETGMECRIYGMRRDISEEVVDGSLRHRPFSETTFVDDLASSRAVLANAGFTLMGEAVYLHKPMLAIPQQRQFEQVLNARYLERCGYGLNAESTGELELLPRFIERLPELEAALAGYSQNGNERLFEAVDLQLERAAAGHYD